MFAFSELVELSSAADRVRGDDECFDVRIGFWRSKRLLQAGDSESLLPASGLKEMVKFSDPGPVRLDRV